MRGVHGLEGGVVIVAQGDRVYELVQLTDLHLVADLDGEVRGVRGFRSSARVIAAMREAVPELAAVLVTGDLSDDGTPASYEHFQALMEGVGAPVYAIPGNHDEPDTLVSFALGGPVRSEREARFGPWQVVLLDSHLPGEVKGRLGAAELEWLDRTLAEGGAKHAIVVLHHNPCDIGSPWFSPLGIDDRDDFYAVLDRHPHVRAVVFGHIHQDFEGARRGVRFLASPAASAQFKPKTDELILDDVAPGFRRLRLLPDGRIDAQVVRVPAAKEGAA